MIRRDLWIGRWLVEFYFAPEGYEPEVLLDRMYVYGAPSEKMRRALELMESGRPNTGFTFSNGYERYALVAIGPTTGGEEFQDSLVHELQHLAVAIATSLGVDLHGETPAYVAGDAMRELAHVVCALGCGRCRHEKRDGISAIPWEKD